jgi:hypothetical protein
MWMPAELTFSRKGIKPRVNAAVIVGCSEYDDPEIADLRFAHEDAARAAIMLQIVAGVNPANIMTLRDQSQQSLLPTRANLLRVMTALGRSLPQAPDMLYFFFSGHGFHSPEKDSDYFLLHDANASLLEESSVSFEVILQLLRKTEARHIVLFLDACRAAISGGRGIERAIPPINVENLSSRGLVSFCSCAPGKLSYESPKIGSGLFTKALCDALGEQGKCVTVQEISHYLEATMPEMARQLGTPRQLAYARVEPLQPFLDQGCDGVVVIEAAKLIVAGYRLDFASPARSPTGGTWPTAPSPTCKPPGCSYGPTPPPAASTCPAASSWSPPPAAWRNCSATTSSSSAPARSRSARPSPGWPARTP